MDMKVYSPVERGPDREGYTSVGGWTLAIAVLILPVDSPIPAAHSDSKLEGPLEVVHPFGESVGALALGSVLIGCEVAQS